MATPSPIRGTRGVPFTFTADLKHRNKALEKKTEAMFFRYPKPAEKKFTAQKHFPHPKMVRNVQNLVNRQALPMIAQALRHFKSTR